MAVDFARLVMPRLAVCALEIGMKRAWDTAPRQKVGKFDIPAAYSLLGGTFAPSVKAKGKVTVSRTYVQRFLLFPFAGGIDDLRGGAESSRIALDWESKVIFYYQSHERLGTATLSDLRYCEGVLGISDVGLVLRTAPGGEKFAALEYALNIVMAAKADTFSPPYSEE